MNRIRVAYPMRVDAFDKPGGDVELIRTYIRFCETVASRQGIAFEGEILAKLHPDLNDFDVVHLTNIDRPFDLYAQYVSARAAGKPVVITPIHHSYREIENYEQHGRGGFAGLFFGVLGFNRLETLRTLIKARRYPELRQSFWPTLRKGIRNAQAEVLYGAAYIFVAADKEANDIAADIGALPTDRIVIIRNGFQMPDTQPNPLNERDIEIAVIARLEARKNQLEILEAIESLGMKAVFVGHPNPNHKGYVKKLRKLIARSASEYIPGVPPQEVAGFLSRAQVHVAASWFEVSSLVDIDAYVLGCRVVASACGGTHELLGDDAYYVEPGRINDIREKISQAVASARNGTVNRVEELHRRIETWDQIAYRLIAYYAQCITDTAQLH